MSKDKYELATKIIASSGKRYYLQEGAYLTKPQTTEAKKTKLQALELEPWALTRKEPLWSEQYSCLVTIERLEAGGKYHVRKVGSQDNRLLPTRGNLLCEPTDEHVPPSDRETKYLCINRVRWSEIKNHLLSFINSYPWKKKETEDGSKTPDQVRNDMIALAKSRGNGLAADIERERGRGVFEDARTFITRMTAAHESFPWSEFAKHLDFIVE